MSFLLVLIYYINTRRLIYYINTRRKLKFPGAVLLKEKYSTYHISDIFSEPGNFHISCIIHSTSRYSTGHNLLYNFTISCACTGQLTCPALSMWCSSHGISLHISCIKTVLFKIMQCNFPNLLQLANRGENYICNKNKCVIIIRRYKSKTLLVSCLLFGQCVCSYPSLP